MDQQTRDAIKEESTERRSMEKELLNEIVELRIMVRVMGARAGVVIAFGGIIMPFLVTWLVNRLTGG